MSREITVLWVGRQRPEWERLCADYRGRIERSVEVRDVALRPARGDDAQRVEREAAALEAALPDPCWTVALDRGGRQRSSVELAEWLSSTLEQWPHPIAFLIGSDLGLDPALAKRCRERLSLGPMTLPHELARLVLYEQLYRGLSIRAGIKYHRGPL